MPAAPGRLSGEEEQLLVDGEAARIGRRRGGRRLTGLETALAAVRGGAGGGTGRRRRPQCPPRRRGPRHSRGDRPLQQAFRRSGARPARPCRHRDGAGAGADAGPASRDRGGLRQPRRPPTSRHSPPAPPMPPRGDAEARLRGPAMEADRTAQRLETEARTLAKLFASPSGDKWPRIIDAVKVSRGYEIAFASALGDDLDASTDRAAPAHWDDTGPGDGDPALPEGARPLPKPSRRRPRCSPPRQVGVVARADGERLRTAPRAGPAARVARGRSLALGRACQRRRSAEPRGRPAPRREEPPRRSREPRPSRRARPPRRGPRRADAARPPFAPPRRTRTPRLRRRAQRPPRSRRRRGSASPPPSAARPRSRRGARRSRNPAAAPAAGLEEAQARRARRAGPARAPCPPAASAEAGDRGPARGGAGPAGRQPRRVQRPGLAREAEIRARRLTAIAAERAAWSERRPRASGRGRRDRAAAGGHRGRARGASTKHPTPSCFDRRAVLSEIRRKPRSRRRKAADELAEAETATPRPTACGAARR